MKWRPSSPTCEGMELTTEASVRAALPTAHQLRAALASGRLLDADGTPRNVARDSYSRTPNGGRFGVRDLVHGEGLLIDVELVEDQDDALCPTPQLLAITAMEEDGAVSVLLSLILTARQPSWLGPATAGGGVRPEIIPTDAHDVIVQAVPDPEAREAMLLALGQTYDNEANAQTGAIGEDHVVEVARGELIDRDRHDLAGQVQRVSIVSDRLGYDVVAPSLDGSNRRLEVKTTTRVGDRLEIYISRNESQVGASDENWALVICRVDGDGNPQLVGWCRHHLFEPSLPADRGRGKWQSVRLVIDAADLTPGLPQI